MAKLTDRQQELLKEGKHFGVVATVAEDGRPQTSVVWVDTDGENVVFNTTNKRAKGRNLRANPIVSISVWDNDDPYTYFEVQGRAGLRGGGPRSTSTSSRCATRARTSTRPSTA